MLKVLDHHITVWKIDQYTYAEQKKQHGGSVLTVSIFTLQQEGPGFYSGQGQGLSVNVCVLSHPKHAR